MALALNPEALEALQLAKRTVPEGEDLQIRHLLSALYHGTSLKTRLPTLLTHIPEPRPLTAEPGRRHLSGSLKSLLAPFSDTASPANPGDVFVAIATSAAGRELLATMGVSADDIDGIKATLGTTTTTKPPNRPDWRTDPDRPGVLEALSEYGRVLTAIDLRPANLFGIEDTLRDLMQGLIQRKQHSVVLIGPPGVGKTVVVHEFARRIATGDPLILDRLRDCDVFELSPAFLKAGASVVGQFEERIKDLLTILEAHPKVILFVDEVHALLQSEMHVSGPWAGASAEFKKAVGSGAISLIGCTTLLEYRHYIEPDKALADRFTQLRIAPPTSGQTEEILHARMPSLRAFYSELEIPDEIVPITVKLADEYLLGRYQPRKSIRLLDQACAWCLVQDPPRSEVTEEAVRSALEAQTGQRVIEPFAVTEEQLAASLKDVIVGQDELIEQLATAVVTGLRPWDGQTEGTRGNFFFAGPTGVGKTETAKVLAEAIGGSSDALVRIDCNTLQGSGWDSREALNVLLGPPPGYIGYVRGEGGLLSKVRDHPDCIVLFDEIEKADPGVGKLLLQILAEGRTEDTEGNPLDFRRAFLVFTSNAGVAYEKGGFGFTLDNDSARPQITASVSTKSVMEELRHRGFPQEFLGRNFQWFMFQSLTPDHGREILRRQLEGLRQLSAKRQPPVAVEWEPEIIDRLVDTWDPQFGARSLFMVLRNRVMGQLSLAEARHELDGVTTIHLRATTDETRPNEVEPGSSTRTREGDTLFIDLH